MNNYLKKLMVFAVCIYFSNQIFSQELKRKAYLGIETISIENPESPCLAENSSTKGICIKNVVKGFTADKMGLKTGDLLTEINGYPVTNSTELQHRLKFVREGENLTATVMRNGKVKKLSAVAIAKPYEKAVNGLVIYDQIKFLGGQVRVIINKPDKNEKMPAILFIQGYPCSSIDNLSNNHPYKKLIETLVAQGIVVVRTEKPGMGDCLGTPECFDIDILTETKAFTEAYKKMKTYEFVDTNNIFIFGHSLGGISAPVVASEMHPKGVIVYGTTCEPWYEYLLKMLRYQNPVFGTDFVEAEKEMKLYQQLLYEHFILKKHPAQLSENADYSELLKRDFQYDGKDGILGRNYNFWFSVNELNLTDYWAKTSSFVLAVYGEADIEALEPEPTKRIADIVNHYHPGKATYYFLPETDHAFLKTGTKEKNAELKASGKIKDYYETHFNYDFCNFIVEWINNLK